MAYIEIPGETLKTAANSIITHSAESSEQHAFGTLLLLLTQNETDIHAARGLFVFGVECSLVSHSVISLGAWKLFTIEQRVIDLLAFYEYLPNFDPKSIPYCVWDKKYLENITIGLLKENTKQSLDNSKLSLSIATLDVLRTFFVKKIKSKWNGNQDYPFLLDFIECIYDHCSKCKNLNEKIEINILFGLLLFVLIHIYNKHLFTNPNGNILYLGDDLYKQCAEFIKIKVPSELALKNQQKLLFQLRDFLDKKVYQVNDQSEQEFVNFRSEIVSSLAELEEKQKNNNQPAVYYDEYSYVDPFEFGASFSEFMYQAFRMGTAVASNIASFFSTETSGEKQLRGFVPPKVNQELFNRWLNAISRLPQTVLSPQERRFYQKILYVEAEEKLDEYVFVGEEDCAPVSPACRH